MQEAHAEEYDLGTIEGFEAARKDPGIPDEMVQEMLQEPRDLASINTELVTEAVLPMLGAVFVTIVVTELVKGLGLRVLLAGWQKDRRQTAYRWCTAIVAGITAFTFGFHESVLNMTGVSVSVLETAIYGSATIAMTAHVLYKWRLVQVLRLKVYKFLRTDPDDPGLYTSSEVTDDSDG